MKKPQFPRSILLSDCSNFLSPEKQYRMSGQAFNFGFMNCLPSVVCFLSRENQGIVDRNISFCWQAMPVEEKDLPAWHTSENVGQAWRNFKWFCIPMTVCHTIDNDLKQVCHFKLSQLALVCPSLLPCSNSLNLRCSCHAEALSLYSMFAFRPCCCCC